MTIPYNSFLQQERDGGLTLTGQWLFHAYTYFFNIVRLIPVEKCAWQVLVMSACCTLPPGTASVFITTVKRQSEKRWLTVLNMSRKASFVILS